MDYYQSHGINVAQGKYHEQSIYSIALLYNLLSSGISDYLKDYGLTIGKLNVLVAIRNQGGSTGISQVDISKHLIVSPANMTKLLDKLEKEGLVTRSPQVGDRRVNVIKITKKATKRLNDLWPGYLAVLKQLGESLDMGKHKQLSVTLRQWVSQLDEKTGKNGK